MKKTLLLLLLTVCTISYTQERKKLITGTVTDSLGIVKNANIINLKTKQGTFSNDDGRFRIFVSKGDTLRVSSVQHQPKKIVVSKDVFDKEEITIQIKLIVYTLEEIELKRNNLQGRLGIDIKDVPKNEKDSLLRKVMDFSDVNFNAPDNTIDAVKRAKPPIVNTMEGAMPMAGAGAKAIIPFKYSEKLWALRKKLEQKKQFPYKILSELGDKFFFDELKIPIDNYFHFLEYCNPLGIEELHKKGRNLEIIKILKTESKTYLKLIKKE